MAIQYSGNAQTSTFTPSTKADVINNVETALLAAGWTTISGHATTNLLMQSATTPQGYAINVRLKDNAGTCVTFSLESTDGSVVGGNSTTVGGAFLNPNAGAWVYRVVSNKYQAFIFATPNPAAARSFAAFGVPYVPSWVVSVTTRLGWMMGNATTDTDTTPRFCFRTNLLATLLNSATNLGQQAMYGSTIWSVNSGPTFATGSIALITLAGGQGNLPANMYRWENNSALLSDPLLAWGSAAASGSANEAKYKGLLWDAVISSDAYTGDSTATFDSHNWIVLTDNNGGVGNTIPRGTLLLATS